MWLRSLSFPALCCWRRCSGFLAGAAPVLALALPAAVQPAPTPITVGVQMVQDSAQELAQWQQWLQTWQAAVPHLQVQLLPLRGGALHQAVQAQQVQFVVSSPGHYVALQARYGAVRLASQISMGAQHSMHAVGSALVVATQSPWQQWQQLGNQPVAAVAEDAFGGYQVMAAQWRKQGWAAEQLQPVFTGYPMERALQALRDGQVQAAVLRVCMLEQWIARGEVAPDAYRILAAPPEASAAGHGNGCQATSALYPGWALAALPSTPQHLSHDVLLAVLLHEGPQQAGRWTVPADYQNVQEVLRILEAEPYARAPRMPWQQRLWRYRWWGLGALLLLALGLGYLLHVEALVKRRTAALTRSLQERDALTQQVAKAKEEMEHMGRLSVLGELSATLAHEISHPLASLSNYVKGLRRRSSDHRLSAAQLGNALEAMEESIDRTTRVLDSVRALARKRVSVQRQARLWPVVCEAVELLQAMSCPAPQSMPVVLECPAELQTAQVVMDALQVQQVVWNLLKNAQDLHRSQGRTELAVVVSLSWASEPHTVVLSVCDQGAAMPPDALARLFEPFYTTKRDGLGLGLAISRSIAELHGGHLQARPQGNVGGLCMQLVLPLAPCEGVNRQPENHNEISL